MKFEQSIHTAMQSIERRQRLSRRAERQYERQAFASWSAQAIRHAESAGRHAPTPDDLKRLKRLAEQEGPFSAAQVVRRGWCGIRSAEDAASVLERFVGNGWLHRAPKNREGQSRYAFTREAALGRLPHEDRAAWDSWESMYDNVPDNRWTRKFNPLVAAGFIDGSDQEEDEGGERPELECGICEVPDPSADQDIWAVARKLAFEEGTALHRIAENVDGLSPIQQAYAIAIAQDRIVSSDPIRTHIRGIADYLGVDYNALRVAIVAAVTAIKSLNHDPVVRAEDNLATPTPTIEV